MHHDQDDRSIAVIGLACRVPGAGSPSDLWELLRSGGSGVTEVPDGRWPGRGDEVLHGGFLDRVDDFDAGFFGISPNEAAAMDPQQRLVLELGWEVLEDAGTTPELLAAGRTGVFVGAMNDEYAALAPKRSIGHHTFTGRQRGMIANRLSYLLGAVGPSLVVDTGQSSSLAAVHLACDELRRGGADLAIAGGVNLNLAFDTTVGLSRFGALSPDGRCHTFDARANGYVRGEGGGLVLLKPLSAALADGDRVHCVIRGGALNNDGGGETLTVPSRAAQEDVLRRAYESAGVDPAEVRYVELHGTGTPVGDPIEAGALGTVLGAARDGDRRLLVGSVKTNVGHLEGAAGITGLIKVALALREGELPPSLNFETPNPDIDFDAWRLRVQDRLSPWPNAEGALVAGVSSFGVGGTNVHLVVEQAPTVQEPAPSSSEENGCDAVPWVVSAGSDPGLRAQAARLREFAAETDAGPNDIGRSLARNRAALGHRGVVVGRDRASLLEGLDALAEGRPHPSVTTGTASADRGVVFVFPGQGSQWAGMGAHLLDSSPVFAASVADCAAALAPHVDWDLVDVLRGDAPLDRVDVLQPALWAVMVSLARVWRSLGIEPAAVVGHSQGEIAAACVTGALSLDDGARLVAGRSAVIAAAKDVQGGMLWIAASAERVHDLLDGRDGVWTATTNGPSDTVVAGDPAALDRVGADCERAGVRAKRVAVDYASHTPHMERLRDRLIGLARPVVPRAADVPMYSTVTTALAEGESLDAEYWYRNLREPVRLHETISAAIEDGHSLFLEVSPHPVLTGAIEETAAALGEEADSFATLRRDDAGPDRITSSLAELWTRGPVPDWGRVLSGGRRVDLPTYAFQRTRHRIDGDDRSPSAEPGPRPVEDAVPVIEPAAATTVEPVADVASTVRAHVAAVLGHGSAADIDPRLTFKELGFDSFTLGVLRTRLTKALAVPLAVAELFDHPSPSRLTAHLTSTREAAPTGGPGGVEARDRPADEPIAIIGMSCRFPGGVASPEDLWSLVDAGGDAISTPPTDRGWDLEALTEVRGGGFLERVADFDARFFGLAPREALAMDPQQRLLLELAWELFERAGIAPETLRESGSGVFIGTMDQEYGPRLHEAPAGVDGFLLTGKTTSAASGRIAYQFGLIGPAMTIDTACSSSLVALHQAVRSLRQGETSLALAGGVTVMSTPGVITELGRQGGLAPDGRSKAFAAGADGMGAAEGAGLVLVERLSDAIRNGHEVLAVVRGSAVNQDGASNGLTAPNGLSQQRVIRTALTDAGLEPSAIDVVEAHGTGTRLGDPIEARALMAAYGGRRDTPVRLGSVKSNIGHTQAAAGIAGVIKTVMAMRHGTVPATLHVDAPTDAVDWSEGTVSLSTDRAPWPLRDGARRAGVSSFGISGTNAHVLLEHTPPDPRPAQDDPSPRILPWVVSGRSTSGLRAQAARLRDAIDEVEGTEADLGWSLASTRTGHDHRAVVLAEDREGFAAGLDALMSGTPSPDVVAGVRSADRKVVFVFPGQGSQWVGMATDLIDASAVFAEAIEACSEALAPHVDWDLVEVLRGGDLDRVDVVQPALWAVMVSLARVWRSLGIEPAAVVGHSQGEIAAACVTGALSLEDGARLVALRSRAIADELAGHGGMLSIAASAERVRDLLVGDVRVAVENGPSSCVVAGSPKALATVLENAEKAGLRGRFVAVDYASHTPQVQAIRDRLSEIAAPIRPRWADVPMHSTVTAARIDATDMDAEYWYENLSEPVRFHETVMSLMADMDTVFLEVSPHPVLTTAIEEIAHDLGRHLPVVGTLRRDQGGLPHLYRSLAELWVHGVAPEWTEVFPDARRVDLPTYAFLRDRYWLTGSSGGVGSGEMPLPTLDLPEDEVPDGLLAQVRAATSRSRQRHIVLDAVCGYTAMVLGWRSSKEIEVGRAFRESGIDSLTAVELRGHLAKAAGTTLSPTVVFDHPTPEELADHLLAVMLGERDVTGPAVVRADPTEPIAIVAASCRFPGGVGSPEDLLRLLMSDRDPNSGFPTDRGWDLTELRHPDTTRPGACSVHTGGFLHDAAEFDAGFFGISPREATAMDPQQRLLLETSWETFERAGIAPDSARGSRTGVFVGLVAHGYGSGATHLDDVEGYVFTGATSSVASGRIAYSLGLTGPAITVDTACSSSLVALHQAVRSLRQGECDLALAGGVTVIATPRVFTDFARQGALAPDGHCKPFAAAADGTAWSEGVGMVLVERLSDARRNGHRVLALIRGSAVNQDGASNGLTAPNGPAQEQVIRLALADADLAPADVDVVEAHGTGTALGDPIEAQALIATYGQDRPADRPLRLGSAKSTIGHSSAVAGIAGVITMTMAMREGVLPGTRHVDEPTPHVDWTAGAVELVTENRPWPESGRERRAAVSSFGVSGTNAHLVLEQAPDERPESRGEPKALDSTVVPWPVSGRTPAALAAQAARLRGFAADDSVDVAGVASSLGRGRSGLDHRAVVVAEDRPDLLAGLDAIGSGTPAPTVVAGAPAHRSGIVFVFPGQGSQWVGMATDLIDASAVFAEAIEACSEALAPHVDWDLVEVLRGGDLDRVDVVQPALWAVMVSLATLWRSVGVEPSAVVGHSQGEIAAACVAGGLSLEDGARLVALRSRVIGRELAGLGGMVSIEAPADLVAGLLEDEDAWIATVNGASSTVIAGTPEAMEATLATCEARGVRAKRIPVDYASHTPQVESVKEALLDLAAPITPGTADVPMYSTVTAAPIDATDMDAEYWYRNLRERVRFHQVVETLIDEGNTTFIEVSAHPVLSSSLQESVSSQDVEAAVVATLRRNVDGPARFLTAMAELWVHGVVVDWARVTPEHGHVDLPTYAFQRERYWLTPGTPGAGTAADEDFLRLIEEGDLGDLAATLRVDEQATLPEVLPALAAWHRGRIERASADSLRYRVDWKPLPGLETATLTGTWLVTGEEGDHATAVADGLSAHGAKVVRDVGHPDIAGVVVIGDLATTLRVLRSEPSAPVWCVTRSAVTAGDEPVGRPEQAQVWGLGRVAAQEMPDIWGGLIDLPDEPDDRAIERLCAVLASAEEDQVAIRATGVLGRRLVRAPLGGRAGAWSPGRGTVLITGGTGAVGGHIARKMAALGAEHLLLVGRRGAEAPGAERLREELVGLGAEVTIAACDVSDREALAALVDEHPVTAVVHAAAVLDDAAITALTPERVERQLRVKAGAAWSLHELTEHLELSAFVLISSIGGTVGMAGQGNYAPGNAYLDALAEYRRARGAVATSVAWGTWSDGMAEDAEVTATRKRHGIPPMDPERATLALEAALAQGDTTVVVADVDWERFAHAYTATRRSPLLDELVEAAVADPEPRPSGALRDRLAGMSARDRDRELRDSVRTQVASVLGYDRADTISVHRRFPDLGMDSVTAIEMSKRIGAATGLRLAPTVMFDHPSIAELASELGGRLFDGDAPSPGSGELDAIAKVIAELPENDPARSGITERLRLLVREASPGELDAASDEELYDLIEEEFGIS
ncbi:SDR family NAD(P)-dependent oxidoreductase [Nocardiopsis alba]|uniref:SDR family NAD(P)-dependent oxidoreductase n=1 Tax=Nocardiopsis alba TaxID=53437 RepID=UPI003659A5F0